MGRFSRIMQGDQLAKDKQALDTFNKKSTADRQEAYKAQQGLTGNLKGAIAAIPGYVRPFDIELDKKIFLLVDFPIAGTVVANKTQSVVDVITKLQTLTTGYTIADAPTVSGSIIVETRGIRGFEPSRITVRRKEGSAKDVKSRLTGNTYSYVKKDSVSTPIGQTAAVDSEAKALSTINNLIAKEDKKTWTLSLKRQKGVVISVI